MVRSGSRSRIIRIPIIGNFLKSQVNDIINMMNIRQHFKDKHLRFVVMNNDFELCQFVFSKGKEKGCRLWGVVEFRRFEWLKLAVLCLPPNIFYTWVRQQTKLKVYSIYCGLMKMKEQIALLLVHGNDHQA